MRDETSLTDKVYEELKSAILAGELAPGTLHSVVDIAKQLGVSRTPVREALLQFSAKGVVRFERSRGVRILELSVKDIEEIYGLRLLLEVPSAHAAATHMSPADRETMRRAFAGMARGVEQADEPSFQAHDVAFHQAFLTGAGNSRVERAVADTRSQIHALGLSTTRTRTLQDVLDVHERIFVAIEERDPEAAATAVREHLQGTMQLLVDQLTRRDQNLPPGS